MDDKEIQHYNRFNRLANTTKDPLKRFGWDAGNTTLSHLDNFDDNIICLVPNGAKILEVGCGDGRLAEKIITRRPDIKFYQAFDIILENIIEAKKRKLPVNFYRGNCWNELSKDGDWDFVISQGVLFSHTNHEYKNLLMDLLHNTAERGFIVVSITFIKPGIKQLKQILDKSINVKEYHLTGEKDTFDLPAKWFNHPFWIIRDGIKQKSIPKIPDILKRLPEDDNKIFKTLFT